MVIREILSISSSVWLISGSPFTLQQNFSISLCIKVKSDLHVFFLVWFTGQSWMETNSLLNPSTFLHYFICCIWGTYTDSRFLLHQIRSHTHWIQFFLSLDFSAATETLMDEVQPGIMPVFFMCWSHFLYSFLPFMRQKWADWDAVQLNLPIPQFFHISGI